jgi:hypothetical protein
MDTLLDNVPAVVGLPAVVCFPVVPGVNVVPELYCVPADPFLHWLVSLRILNKTY